MRTKALVLAAMVALWAQSALAAEHVGRVTLAGGVPVPGARVTATQGASTLVTTTDTQGAYRFMGIAEGTWSIQVEMVGLSPQKRDVAVADRPPGPPAAGWRPPPAPLSPTPPR